MTKKVRTIWQGKIGLHEKYIKESLARGESIEIVYIGKQEQYLGQKMEILPDQLKSGEFGKELFPERQRSGFYRLIYFSWQPLEDKQQKLI